MKSPTIGICAGLTVVLAATSATADHYFEFRLEHMAGLARNYLLTLNPPKGTLTVEANDAVTARADAATVPTETTGDWPSYNKTLASNRFSGLDQINTRNVAQMEVVCTYDTEQTVAFETGLIVVDGALIGTTEFDTFSIDPATCEENWRTHEHLPPGQISVNGGVAHLDGRLFRGTQGGQVAAYDFTVGKTRFQEGI